MAIIFDGKKTAADTEAKLQAQVAADEAAGKHRRVVTFVFMEDEGSVIYANLKLKAAERIGIDYIPIECHLNGSLIHLTTMICYQAADPTVTGVMIQKPTKAVFQANNPDGDFASWWKTLTDAIDPAKDIDGLTGKSKFLPATVKACLTILDIAKASLNISDVEWQQNKVLVLGRSDIVGKPLAERLQSSFALVDNFGKAEFSALLQSDKAKLAAYDIVIAAVGVPDLIAGDLLKEGVIAIDVGSPQGDMERKSVEAKAAFLTPVPGGVGPMTVISLMENIVSA